MSWQLLMMFCRSLPFLIALCIQDYIAGIFLLNRLNNVSATHVFADDETEWLHSADLQYVPRLQI